MSPSNVNTLARRSLQSVVDCLAPETGDRHVLSDQELVELCLRGEQSAWTTLIERYQRLIYSVARVFCDDQDDLADVFQATCLDLYRGLPVLRDAKALPAWLMTVTRRRCFAFLRDRIPQAALAEEDEIPEAESGDTIQAIENEHAIERALERLPEKWRVLIDLLYFNEEQPSYSEIASRLGIPVASVGPTRARCFDKLRKILS